ncbi:MAG: hypothetical protein M1308_19215, partial [Actinobacteria bacterium]|nr:hypothetical protein [Actinomycetota bacterium]
ISQFFYIVRLIDYSYKTNKEAGCTGKLIEQGFCKKDEWGSCTYWNEYKHLNQYDKEYDDSLYDTYGWPEYLYNFRNGYPADIVYKELRKFRSKFGLPQTKVIYIGLEKLASSIRLAYRDFKPDAMRIRSAIHTLEKVGLVKIAEKGSPGQFKGKANGYLLIYPLPRPP